MYQLDVPSCRLPTVGSRVTMMMMIHVPLQFEMLTGALPFQGQNRKETMTLILK